MNKNVLHSYVRILIDLVKRDIKAKYLGSYLGILWSVITPILNILIFWFVFEFGFRSMPVSDYPFILWLIAGIVPWFFIGEAIINGTNAIVENSFLVKKVVFKIYLLSIIKIFSALIINIVFIIMAFIAFILYGFEFDVYILQLPYYILAAFMLVWSISMITSTINVFFRDMAQIISVFVQFGFWVSPIVWSLNMMPEEFHSILKFNPTYHIVNGFRDMFIYKQWFWEDPIILMVFWLVVAVLFLIGFFLFNKLKSHFSDVL